MDIEQFLALLGRWVHVGTAIILLGGSCFMRFVLMPAAALLPDDEHDRLRERVMARWRVIVMAGIAFLLGSGFYNYLTSGKHGGLYHGLMGVKMLLGFGVFFLASALSGRSPALATIRRNSSRWMSLMILLAFLTVAIAGFLKIAVPVTN